MVERHRIDAFVDELSTQFHPTRVILFGSHAAGHPTNDSDVDLLVIMRHDGPPAMKAAEIRKQIHAGFPLDLVVRSPSEIRRRLATGDVFIREVIEQGQPLYEG